MKQVLSFKKFKHHLQLVRRQNGQAVIEYVLLLIISVSLLFAFKNVVTGIDQFMYKFMGEYISCLMEYGELPSGGIQKADLKQHTTGGGGGKVCDSKFDSFSLASGRSASSGKGGNSSQISNNKNSSKTAASEGAKANQESKANDKKSLIGASNGSGSSSAYENGTIKRASDDRASSGTADDGSANLQSKVKVIDQDESEASLNARLGAGGIRPTRIIYERRRYKALTGKEIEEFEKQNKSLRKPTSLVLGSIDESGRIGPRKSIFTPPATRPTLADTQDEAEMNFGYFMKWLIIAAIGIAIFLFFGSQVMNFMNSQEK